MPCAPPSVFVLIMTYIHITFLDSVDFTNVLEHEISIILTSHTHMSLDIGLCSSCFSFISLLVLTAISCLFFPMISLFFPNSSIIQVLIIPLSLFTPHPLILCISYQFCFTFFSLPTKHLFSSPSQASHRSHQLQVGDHQGWTQPQVGGGLHW